VDSFVWDANTEFPNIPSLQRDSIRIRVSDAGSDISDMSGWYFTLKQVLRSFSSGCTSAAAAGSNRGESR